MIVIGITGPTGAGKSTVCRELLGFGYGFIDADKVAKDVMDKNNDCKKKLASFFGNDILDDNYNLIRENLAKKAFLNAENTEMLNKITHPIIIEEIKSILFNLKEKGENVVLLDVPLLFETGLNRLCNFTIAIIADENIRWKRLLKRDKLDKKLINMRILAQNKNDFYKKWADYVLTNNGDFKEIYLKIADIMDNIVGENK